MPSPIPSIARAAVLLLGCNLAVPAFQSTPETKALVEGRVVNAATGEAVRRVAMRLSCTSVKGEFLPAVTDENGRFAYRNLAPGTCRLSGEKAGFQRTAYGARLNPESGIPLALAAGQQINDIVLKLVPTAAISGRVLDQDGEPMPNLVIIALRSVYNNGRRRWTQDGGAQTNDRGEFRISDLKAGKYLLSAANLNIGIGLAGVSTGALPDKPEANYGLTYYGNTTDITRAVPVDLRMGEDRRGLDMQMVKTATVRVRGHVVGATEGKSLALAMLRKASAAGGSAIGALGVVQNSDGSFEIKGVPPGSYIMMAFSSLEGMTAAGSAMPVEVGEQHIDGLEFHIDAGGGDLAGTVSVPGDPAKRKEISVVLHMVDFNLPQVPRATPAEDGTFTVKNVFRGRYRVEVTGLPENAYVKSIKLGGQQIDAEGADVSGGSGKLEIAVSTAGARVEGTVLHDNEKPAAGATVVLIPDSRRESEYLSGTTEPNGTFTLKGVRPGKYRIIAWEDIEPGAYLDPEFLKPFAGRAQALALEEDGRSKVSLKAVPFEQVAGSAAVEHR